MISSDSGWTNLIWNREIINTYVKILTQLVLADVHQLLRWQQSRVRTSPHVWFLLPTGSEGLETGVIYELCLLHHLQQELDERTDQMNQVFRSPSLTNVTKFQTSAFNIAIKKLQFLTEADALSGSQLMNLHLNSIICIKGKFNN